MTNNTMGNGELLVLKDLNVWYTKGKPVLEHFSVELGNNEAVGLIGLNGAGKTTFIKTLSGLLNTFQVKAAWWQADGTTACSKIPSLRKAATPLGLSRVAETADILTVSR